MAEQRRRWSPEFKRDAVHLVRSSGRPVPRSLASGAWASRAWGVVTKDRKAMAVGNPEAFAAETAASEQIRRLRKRVVELETERAILEGAAVPWMKEQNG
jgi:transposase